MPDPVLHLIVGPNGSGKSTLFDLVIRPETHLEFVNADVIAANRSFATETVFSHPSKLDVVATAVGAGYLVTLHVVMIPEDLAVARVSSRVTNGGHFVPEEKIRQRYDRLWPLVARAIEDVDEAILYDNSRAARPFRIVATWRRGHLLGSPDWPRWTPEALGGMG